jgi:hypothetical protein
MRLLLILLVVLSSCERKTDTTPEDMDSCDNKSCHWGGGPVHDPGEL